MRDSFCLPKLKLSALVAVIGILCCSPCLSGESATNNYKKGLAAEERGDVVAAYRSYKAAFDLAPKEIKYRTTYERVRPLASIEYVKQGERFVQSGNLAGALADFL